MIDEDYSMEIQGDTDNLVSVEKEQQAYKMLQSIPYSDRVEVFVPDLK